MTWFRVTCAALTALSLAAVWSCGSTNAPTPFANPNDKDGSVGASTDGGDSSIANGDGPVYQNFPDAAHPGFDGGSGGCQNLQCQVHACGDGGSGTTITGKVMDPAGHNPIYNVVVYIPNAPDGELSPIPIGVSTNSCSCGALFSGQPITYALTDTNGNFTLNNVPDGTNIPLVVQIGKWRKEITLNTVTECGTNTAGTITLPKNLTDGKFASLPNIAVSTGGADTLECLLTRVGVDEAFFTGATTGPGVHIFHGSGGHSASGSAAAPTSLWDSEADLLQYDIVMLSCEGAPTLGVTATTASYLGPYVASGGRVFAEHYHYAFFTDYSTNPGTDYPQFPNVANWDEVGNAANDQPYGNYTNGITGVIETTLPSGAMFPEGSALKSWLGGLTPSALNTNGEIVVPLLNARDNAIVTSSNVATPWVQTDSTITPASTQYFSWDMPFNPPVSDAGVPEYCGRVVYSDMHVSGSANDYPNGIGTVPSGCDSTSTLSADEDAIEFILFDLSSCITPVGFTPVLPQPEGGITQ